MGMTVKEESRVALGVVREMQVVGFAVVSGYCDTWQQVCDVKAEHDPVWVGIDAEIKALGLHADPSQRHLGWSVAAGLALHAAEFEGVADEVGFALLVAGQAVGLAELERGVVYV